MNETHKKNPINTFLLSVLVMVTVGTAAIFYRDMVKLNNAYSDIMQVEAISSTTQRQVRLSENNEHQQREIFNISALTEKALTINGENAISLMSDPAIAVLGKQVYDEWLVIEEYLTVNWKLEEGEEAKELDYISIRLVSDAHFMAMTDLSNGIGDHTEALGHNISQYQLIILVCAILIAAILINNGLQTRAELTISKEMAAKAQIDSATGLYNRSRCQELFKNNQSISGQRSPAIMVFDLNDLKKTNDNLGHRVGDELIGSFAEILKNGCSVHNVPPFIGRYGGDEFVVYYEDIENEDELKIYLKELDFLTTSFNERETRFQVSYAVGYAYHSNNTDEHLTARQLFDKADAEMYIDKEAGKRAKNPNYDEEKAKGEGQ